MGCSPHNLCLQKGPPQARQRLGRSVSLVRMSRLLTLLLSGPAPPDAVAVWFEDLPLDARLECCYGPSNHPRAMGLWFPNLAADAKLQIIVGPAPAGPCMGIWRGTVLDWPGSVFMVGEPPKPGFGGCWVRPGEAPAELEAMFGLPEGGHPGIWFRGPRARPGVWR